MKVWCPARGQTEADAVEVILPAFMLSMENAARAVADDWSRRGDGFDRETFRVSDGHKVFDIEIKVIRDPTFHVVGTRHVEDVWKEQG